MGNALKQLTYKQAKSRADRYFSKYIRLRDTPELSGGRYGYCISCGKLKEYKDLQCGHFINRKWLSLRYDEKNCNAQCVLCNCFDEGNSIGYMDGLKKKYGNDILDYLLVAKKQVKLSAFELKTIGDLYRDKIKGMI